MFEYSERGASEDRDDEPQTLEQAMQQMTGRVAMVPVHPMMRIPAPVMCALQFIENCNDRMGLRAWPKPHKYDQEPGYDLRELELHPTQEFAFRAANRVMAYYFLTSIPEGERGRTLSPPDDKTADIMSAVSGKPDNLEVPADGSA